MAAVNQKEDVMNGHLCRQLVTVAMMAAATPATANVITDWDDKAVVAVTPMASLGGTNPYMAQRMMGMVHAAMFDAVNSIERRYRSYLVQLPAAAGSRRRGGCSDTVGDGG